MAERFVGLPRQQRATGFDAGLHRLAVALAASRTHEIRVLDEARVGREQLVEFGLGGPAAIEDLEPALDDRRRRVASGVMPSGYTKRRTYSRRNRRLEGRA